MKNSDYFQLKQLSNDTFELLLFDIWNNETLVRNIKDFENLNISKDSKLTVDFENLKECNSNAIIYLISFFKTFKSENITIKNLC